MKITKVKIITNSEGIIELSIPTEWKNCEVEVIVNSLENKPKKPKLDEFFGKLEWQGDPLTLQGELRNEWSN
jgi:hypothetical protein